MLHATTMDVEKIIDSMLDGTSDGTADGTSETSTMRDTTATTTPPSDGSTAVVPQKECEWLAALVAGGQSQQYLGKEYTIEQIDSLRPDEVERLYTRYELWLGAVMTKTLGQAMIQLYMTAVSRVFPKIPPNEISGLADDLNADPFLGHLFTAFFHPFKELCLL